MHERAVLLVGPVTAFYILDLIALALRVWARHIKKTAWRLSDYAIFIAAIFGTGYIAICWIGETPRPETELLSVLQLRHTDRCVQLPMMAT
jgi:hypothetical protein